MKLRRVSTISIRYGKDCEKSIEYLTGIH
jgi:hypothetical protein